MSTRKDTRKARRTVTRRTTKRTTGDKLQTVSFTLTPTTVEKLKATLAMSTISTSAFVESALLVVMGNQIVRTKIVGTSVIPDLNTVGQNTWDTPMLPMNFEQRDDE